MSKCEACGGDGLIEVGAYRGDEDDTATRECRLCGGKITTDSGITAMAELGFAAELAAQSLTRLAQVGSSLSACVLPRLPESTNGSRREVRKTVTPISFLDAKLLRNAHGFYESREPVSLPVPVRRRCKEGHAWRLVKYVNGGRVVKCSACDKMKYRKQ